MAETWQGFGLVMRCSGTYLDVVGAVSPSMCVAESALALKSPRVTFEEAAATPQAAVLALQGLRDKGQIEPGHEVLINGARGGVGTFAVQIAKSFEAEVTGVDSTSKLDMLRSLGADHVIDYTREDFTRNGKRYDLILDVVASRSVFAYKTCTQPQGQVGDRRRFRGFHPPNCAARIVDFDDRE